MAVLDQIRVSPDLSQMLDDRRSPPAHLGGDPVHFQLLDPPFSCQLGVVDCIAPPSEGAKLATAQNAWFE